jgi:hypothetical protein
MNGVTCPLTTAEPLVVGLSLILQTPRNAHPGGVNALTRRHAAETHFACHTLARMPVFFRATTIPLLAVARGILQHVVMTFGAAQIKASAKGLALDPILILLQHRIAFRVGRDARSQSSAVDLQRALNLTDT